jgi:chromosomal replication initiation ATPase DnaA
MIHPYLYPGLPHDLSAFIENQLYKVFGVTLTEVMVKTRKKNIVVPRQVYLTAMCRFCGATEHGFPAILWDRFRFSLNHSTLHHCKDVIEKVFLPRKVMFDIDIQYAELVNQFWSEVQKESKRIKSLQ